MWTRKSVLLTAAAFVLLTVGVAARSVGALATVLMFLSFVVVNRLLFRGSENVIAEPVEKEEDEA